MSVANPLSGSFASVGMPPTDIVEELDQDPVLSSGSARFGPEDDPSIHYIDRSFRDGLKMIIDFQIKFSFKRNYWVVILSPTDTVNNPPPGCIAVYLEALEYGLRFPYPKLL